MISKRNLIKQAKKALAEKEINRPPTPEERELMQWYSRKYHEIVDPILAEDKEMEILDYRTNEEENKEQTLEDIEDEPEDEVEITRLISELDRELAEKWEAIKPRNG